MFKLFKPIPLISTFLLLGSFLTGCGGSADANDSIIPPIPDVVENSKTIAGIDINNNQVRDDIENYIYVSYSKEDEQKALMQTASVIQNALINVNTKEDIQSYYQELSKAQSCSNQVFGEDSKEYSKIRAKTLSTMDRVERDLNISLLMSGEVFTDTWEGNPCE